MSRTSASQGFKVETEDGHFDIYIPHQRGKLVVVKDSHIIRANLVRTYVPADDAQDIPHFLDVPSSIPKAA